MSYRFDRKGLAHGESSEVRGADRPHGRRLRGVVRRAAPPGERCAERRDGPARRHRLRPVRVLRVRPSTPRTSTPSPPVGSSSRTSTSRRSARPPGRRCSPAARSTRSGMRALSNFSTGFPNQLGHISPHAATVAEVLRAQGYATMCTGKWHLAPMEQCSAAGPFEHWPLGRGFDRFYGFLEGETDQFHPDLVCDNHPIDPPAGPEDGYHLSEDLVDQLLRMISDSKGVRPDRPFFAYLAVRRHPRAPPGAARVPRQVPGRVRRGLGRDAPALVRAPARARRDPRGHRAGTAQPGRRAVGRPAREPAAAGGPPPGGVRRVPRPHRRPDRPAGRRAARAWASSTTRSSCVLADNGASQEGGPYGVMHEMKFFNGILETPDEAIERIDDIGGPHSHTNYPWGWAQCGNTPVQVVQAEHPRGRRPRAADRALAGRHRRRPGGHEAGPVRERRRRRAHDLRAARRHAARAFRGLDQLPVTGHSFASAIHDAAGAGHQHRCSTSRWRAAGPSSPASGRRCASTSRAPTTTPSRGSCTTSPTDRSECHDLAARAARASSTS